MSAQSEKFLQQLTGFCCEGTAVRMTDPDDDSFSGFHLAARD